MILNRAQLACVYNADRTFPYFHKGRPSHSRKCYFGALYSCINYLPSI